MRRSAALPALLPLPALLLLACSRPETAESTGAAEGTPDVAMGVPVTTSSNEGREHYLLGLHLLDMGRLDEARPHFEQAVAADSSFAAGQKVADYNFNSPGLALIRRAAIEKLG
jgi:hypothetical protein